MRRQIRTLIIQVGRGSNYNAKFDGELMYVVKKISFRSTGIPRESRAE